MNQRGLRSSFVADVVVLSAAVMSGLKGEAIVNDGAEDESGKEDVEYPVDAFFHAVVWVVGCQVSLVERMVAVISTE